MFRLARLTAANVRDLTRSRFCFLLVCLAVVLAGSFAPYRAVAVEPAAVNAAPVVVPVRVWPHAGYGRIVLDWPRDVGHRVGRDGDDLNLTFDAPFSAKLDEIKTRLGAYSRGAEVAKDGRSLRVTLNTGVRFKTYKSGNSLVVDLLPPRKASAASLVVPVRIGTHATFNRLVFDWPRDAKVTIRKDKGRTIIAFDRKGTLDIAALRKDPPPFIRRVETLTDAKTAVLALELVPGAQLRHFRTGMSIVVDVLRPSGVVAAAKPAPKAKAKAKAEAKAKAAPKAKPKAAKVAAPVARPTQPPDNASGPVALFDMSGKPVNTLASRVVTRREGRDIASKKAAKAAGAPTSLLGATQAAPKPSAVPVILTIDGAQAVMKFHWPEEVGAAVFERAGFLWAVFDRESRLTLEGWDKAMAKPSPNSKRRPEEIPAKAFIARAKTSSMPGTTVLRMKIPDGINPRVARDGSAWVVTLERDYLKPAAGINVESHLAAAAGARLYVDYADAGQAVAINDPEVGDRIWVVPLAQPEKGVGLSRTYAEVELFATAQGIAGRPISDNIVFRTLPKGIEIAARDGLTLSGISVNAGRNGKLSGDKAGLLPGQTRPGWLFDFESWRRAGTGGFVENKHKLLRAAAMAPPTTRNTARLELAQLYFSYNYLTDVLGLLQVIEQDEPELAQEPVFRALRGAAYYRLGDLERAGRDLGHASLDGFKEIAIWRAALAAAGNDWVAASRFFARAEAVMRAYPLDLRIRFGLLAAEASLNIGDVGLAKFHIDSLRAFSPDAFAAAQINFLRGRLLAKVLDPEGASASWKKAIEGPDRRTHVLATMARTDLMLEKGKITNAEAVAALEKLRFSWRGDALEFKVLNRLGQAYMEAGDYKNGLMTLRELATHFAAYPGVDKVIDNMRAAFVKLYVDGAADKIAPLTALALYDQFRELTPQGPVGNELIQRLAQRLVSVDLLDRAATLLRHLVDDRLSGTDRLDASNQLALVYLLDRKPQEALDALAGQVPADLIPRSATTRRHLKARALTELARYKEALTLVNNDASVEAERLRAEVFWKLRDWVNAAVAYDRIIKVTIKDPDAAEADKAKAPPALDAEAQQDVLSLAIAHALGRNQKALLDLRMRFLGRMAATGFKESFDVITAPSGIIPDDFRAITGKVAEVDQFRAFMKSYREKLLGRDRSSDLPAKATPGATPQAQSASPAGANG